MNSRLRSMITFATLGLTGVVAGGTVVASAHAGAPAAALKADAPPAETPHGIVQMIGEALTEVTLTADQETTVEQLGAKVEPIQAGVDQAESDLLLALAQQVRAGSVDCPSLEPQIAAYVSARESASTALRGAIEELHGLLDADQRADFADALECRIHDAVRAVTGQRLDDFALALGLSDAQKQEVLADLQQLQPAIQRERSAVHTAIEGFRGDAFAVETYLPASDIAAKARRRADSIIELTGSIFAILDAPQRDKLAARIEAAARVQTDSPEDDTFAVKPGPENVGATQEHFWAAGGRRGFVGGRGGFVAGGSRGFVAGGSRGFVYGRTRAYPGAAGWGWGW
jgi:hypothetical protein